MENKHYFITVDSMWFRLPEESPINKSFCIAKDPFGFMRVWGDKMTLLDFKEITKEQYEMSNNKFTR